jgi:hypothetical protein
LQKLDITISEKEEILIKMERLKMRAYCEIPVHERRIIIVASRSFIKNRGKEIDWRKLGIDWITPLKLYYVLFKSLSKLQNPVHHYKRGENMQYPVFEPNQAIHYFVFPPQQPKDGLVYACCDIEPNLYVPLAQFHTFMYQHKMSAFTELCSNLGAKSCEVVYSEEEKTKSTKSIKVTNVPTKLGPASTDIGIDSNSLRSESASVFFSFPKPKKEIKEYHSNWMNGEPTWVTLQKLRLERDVDNYRAEFNYTDDMGINVKVASSIAKSGIDIGGSFNNILKRKYIFNVVFWPKE